ncbi:MAG: hypothetical protein ACQJCO_04605 [cyanobacterium endosymbiont of Rhopalodia sterrenbergii]
MILHSTGVGKITLTGVKKICVEIGATVVTELSDSGSVESVDILTKSKKSIYIWLKIKY